ncbi:SIR2 family protein [Aquisphaera insulae]|uniref:SIR2 family protein n=1 Tax=Aquisphaera insulae TaxID=2712864 RepID=UPI0013EE3826|nr:SIR2 family protein [Aquisphaera insulae]
MPLLDAIPEELIAAFNDGRGALFAGAGLSIASGFPNWPGLLLHLIERGTKNNYFPKKKATELKKLVNKDKRLLMVAQEISDLYGDAAFRDEIAKLFEDDTKSPNSIHLELPLLPLCLIVTTNYDNLLERAYATVHPGKIPSSYTHEDAPDFADALWRGKFFILKAHGDSKRKSRMIITERDYRNIIHSSRGYRSVLSAIFTTKTVLFLGVSLSDPEIQLLLGYLHDAFHGSGQYHYALVSKEEFSDTDANRWRNDFKVRCIRYSPTAGHPEVLEFVKQLPHPKP